jgi:shikimate kinase
LKNVDIDLIKKTNIAIIGMPGSGKTTLCKELAILSKKDFVDVDSLIVSENNISIAEIFEKYGEAYFRKLECDMIQRLSLMENTVISTGGGCVKNEDNINNLKRNAIIVYVKRDLEKLETAGRPLSAGGLDSVKKLFEERQALYEKYSDIKVKNNTDIQDCATRIYKSYLDYIKSNDNKI